MLFWPMKTDCGILRPSMKMSKRTNGEFARKSNPSMPPWVPNLNLICLGLRSRTVSPHSTLVGLSAVRTPPSTVTTPSNTWADRAVVVRTCHVPFGSTQIQ